MNELLQKFSEEKFQSDLIYWYQNNKRQLPWRETRDPYLIWISEVMLQQTQVETVIPYYNLFKRKYPTAFDLAEADEQEVLKDWEGLGYYSRARNLHNAAKVVATKHEGNMPRDLKELGDLKGIGPYTRGAIASIAFGLPEPAVDGNVFRVISRVLVITENTSEPRVRRIFEDIIREIISQTDPSSFNQGLMELGARICTPTSPKCEICPVAAHCRAYSLGIQTELPIKNKAKKQRVEKYALLLITNSENKVVIEQRPSEGLLANMWQFPMVSIENEWKDLKQIEKRVEKLYGTELTPLKKQAEYRHVFSHIIWELEVYTTRLINENPKLKFVEKKELNDYPFSISHIKAMPYL